VFIFSIIWKQFAQTCTELDLQPTIIFKICNVLWFCCNSVTKFSFKWPNFIFSLWLWPLNLIKLCYCCPARWPRGLSCTPCSARWWPSPWPSTLSTSSWPGYARRQAGSSYSSPSHSSDRHAAFILKSAISSDRQVVRGRKVTVYDTT